jgi:hypothetical protein
VFAIPLVIFGNIAYQYLIRIVAFLFSLKIKHKSSRANLLLLWIVLVPSSIILHNFVTSGDLLAISVYIFLVIPVCAIVSANGRRQMIGSTIWLSTCLYAAAGIKSILTHGGLILESGWKNIGESQSPNRQRCYPILLK